MDNNYHLGKWNFETCRFRVLTAVIDDEPAESKAQIERSMNGRKRYPWFFPFIGTIRQIVEVTQDGQTFYLDNMDGSGLSKVNNGGHWRLSHYSVYPSEIVDTVPKEQWNEYSKELDDYMQQEINEAWMAIDADGYTQHLKDMERLRAAYNKMKL